MSETPASTARPRSLFGLSVKLYLAIAGAVALTLAASVVAWISFVELGQLQRRITREHIPSMTDSLRLARQSALMAATAPSLVSSDTELERASLMERLRSEQRIVDGLIEQLDRQTGDTTASEEVRQLITSIREASRELTDVLDRLDRSVEHQLALRAALDLRANAAIEFHRRLTERLEPLLDDATMVMVTGYRSLDETNPIPPAQRFIERELLEYAAVARLGGEANQLGGLLAEAVNVPDASLLQPIGERFEAAADRFRNGLELMGGADAEVLRVSVGRLVELGEGPAGVFAPRRALLGEIASGDILTEQARAIAERLTADVDRLVAGVEERTAFAVAASNRAIDIGGTLLLVLNAVSILGAVLIAWLYVARRITAPVVSITGAAASFEEQKFDPESLAAVRKRTDELGDLARTFTAMADQVQARTETLDRLVAERTSELENVANRLAKYLSPQIYSSIFSAKGETQDRLARKNLTIFFSDIEGFTDITDGMEPERLSFFINTYLSEMSHIAIEHGGTIDKFIGDAMLVFFGDPETEGDRVDALKCARMAIRMRERVRELEKVWHENGISRPLRVRMGITTGYCTVGNFGSETRLEYTVLGGPVNLASRLQTAAEADTILMSDSTYLLIRDVAEAEPMGEITPKGFARPVACYRLDALRERPALREPVSRTGRHVEVNIADRRNMREAVEELRNIEADLTRTLAKT